MPFLLPKLLAKSSCLVENTPPPVLIGLSETYAGRELRSVLEGMVTFTQFVSDERVIKTNKLKGITEMILNLDELDNADNLEDGRPSNVLLIM